MDYHDLQRKLFELDPVDPAEDKRRMMAAAQGGAVGDVPPTKDYVNESVDVPQGSMPLGLDSVADFAALAGVKVNEAQKHGDYARGKDPMPAAEPGRTKHPLKDKLVGEDENTEQNPDIDALIGKFVEKGMPEKAARMFAQIAYMHFNQQMEPIGADMSDPDVQALMKQAKKMDDFERSASRESIKNRLLAALNEFK
jgi:hypothetical protein